YAGEKDPAEISARLKKLDEVEWAEPKYIYKTEAYTPNDPINLQANLVKIHAAEAWDISKGDTNVIISIVDTGIDWDHPDLAANIWINRKEIPNNGRDDDNNGYVDDYRGWDFGGLTGTPDNNPMEDSAYHGTHVAGIASAVTDNSIGIASIGFRCRLMAVKTTRDDLRGSDNTPLIAYGFEGIQYAAENGAKIINCSWGGEAFSQLGQDVVNFAISKGALVVAAAGNESSSNLFYPASYSGVLAVASTENDDRKSFFSNYGSWIDVTAPGSSIYSTWMNDTYAYLSGTSMSSPLAAGLAGLVAARFPGYSPLQIAEQIRVTSDNIYALNPLYDFQLGNGRINAFNALNNLNTISVRAVEATFSDEQPGGNGDNIFLPGETISIAVKFINYLNPTSGLNITLESRNPNAVVQNGSFFAGAVAGSDSFENSTKFTVLLGNNIPFNTILSFNLIYSDGSYSDFQTITTFANPTFATQRGNNVAMTITGKGSLGFNDYPSNLQGEGFRYFNGPNLLFEGALMTASSAVRVSDAARGSSSESGQNSDFEPVQPFKIISEGNDMVHGSAEFNDNGAGSERFGMDVLLDTYTFSDSISRNFIILKYSIINRTADIISNLYPGLFFDWDLAGGPDDLTSYDLDGKFGFVHNAVNENIPWAAAGLISRGSYGFWAINNGGGDGGFSIYDGFTDTEKFQSLASGIGKPQAGPGDISFVVSTGPLNIGPSDTAAVAFAVAGGTSLNDLRSSILNARLKYKLLINDTSGSHIPDKYFLYQNYPNPFNPNTIIQYSLPEQSNVSLKVYDILGNEVRTLVNRQQQSGNYKVEFKVNGLSSGVYFYRIQAGSFSETKKMIILK
ncbi:MAG TPA: S8 family serine peptidase, partial [Ignavibacteriaceae bacterium]|nr:S8 family serine peptidase [Ignavibacteriaceae bacterium]